MDLKEIGYEIVDCICFSHGVALKIIVYTAVKLFVVFGTFEGGMCLKTCLASPIRCF
jgi:hypothetical protein